MIRLYQPSHVVHRRLRPQELLIGRVAARETPADGGVQRFNQEK